MSVGQVNRVPLKPGGGIRIGYIDALKGFAILCVVLGHVADGYLDGNTYPEANQVLFDIFNTIYAFHMPLFMMISGYVYAVAYFDDAGRPDNRRIYRQIGNVAFVYVLFSVIFGLVKVAMSRYTNKPVVVTDIIMIWCKPISPYWYLYDLMLLYLIFKIPVFYKTNRNVLMFVLTVAAFCSNYVSIGWFQIPSILYLALFFYMGFSNRVHSDWLFGKKRFAIVSFAVGIVLSIIFWDKNSYTVREKAVFLNSIPVVNVFIALGLSLMLWYLFRNVRWLSENRLLTLLGRYSLEIYVMHCFLTAGFRVAFSRVGVGNAYTSLALNFVLSTFIPLMAAIISKRLGIHDLLFRPVNYISRLKSKEQQDK